MGLLESLAADLISNAIPGSGFVTRRMVRRAVGSPLVLAGGAALAGALISEMARGQQGGGLFGGAPAWSAGPPPGPMAAAPVSGAAPPLPPLPNLPPLPVLPAPEAAAPTPATPPAAAPLPPLPPPPAAPIAAVGAAELDNAAAGLSAPLLYAVVRTMVAAALADGTLGVAERERIEGRLGSGELDEAQAAQVRRDLLLPAMPTELAAMVSGDAERELLYRFGALVVNTEAGVSALEATWLERLGEALALTAERRGALESELFAADV